jgi:hypothetical protein
VRSRRGTCGRNFEVARVKAGGSNAGLREMMIVKILRIRSGRQAGQRPYLRWKIRPQYQAWSQRCRLLVWSQTARR